MELKLLRNATLKIRIADRTILVDPFFAAKESMESFAGRSRNPLVDLPIGPDEILEGVELIIVSHLHEDHFDSVAQARVPKDLRVICQPGDEGKIREFGFLDVTPLLGELDWNGIKLVRREGRHGFGSIVDRMGPVMGFTLEAPGEPKVYWSGDTVLYPAVEETIRTANPDVIVIHPCGALWDGEAIAMDAAQAVAVCRLAPRAVVVATHLESLDHATVDRAQLRQHALANGISTDQLRIPGDGEMLRLEH